jgi:preprotein translocase subunit SecB
MTDQSNGGASPAADGQRHLVINVQYVKDLSFENPRAPQSLLQQQGQTPEINMGVDVKAQALAQDIFEVVLATRVDSKLAGESIFVVELVYAAVVTLANVAQQDVPLALLVETPRLLFPFARAIIAEVTRDGGFPPFLLNQIDFAELYRRQLAAAQAAPTATA